MTFTGLLNMVAESYNNMDDRKDPANLSRLNDLSKLLAEDIQISVSSPGLTADSREANEGDRLVVIDHADGSRRFGEISYINNETLPGTLQAEGDHILSNMLPFGGALPARVSAHGEMQTVMARGKVNALNLLIDMQSNRSAALSLDSGSWTPCQDMIFAYKHTNKISEDLVAESGSFGCYFEKALKPAWESFDRNNDGKIDFVELRMAMMKLGMNKNIEELRDMLASVDDDMNGTLDYEEFSNLLGSELVKDLGCEHGQVNGSYVATWSPDMNQLHTLDFYITSAEPDGQISKEAIQAVQTEWFTAYNNQDWPKLVSYYTEDGHVTKTAIKDGHIKVLKDPAAIAAFYTETKANWKGKGKGTGSVKLTTIECTEDNMEHGFYQHAVGKGVYKVQWVLVNGDWKKQHVMEYF